MITVGYARVSTASGEQVSSLRSQLAWLEEQGCSQTLHDVESGLNVDRPGYTQLLQLVSTGNAQTIRATRADRLGRDGIELIRLIQAADAAGVLVSTRDDGVLSAKTAEELLLLYVRAALAQGESMKISSRVHAGLKQGRLEGRPMRRPCWGYKLSADKTCLEPDPQEFGRAKALIELLINNNWRMLPTMREFPEAPFKSVRGLRFWIRNPVIRGGIGYGQLPDNSFKTVLWDRHQPLITHDEYAAYERHTRINRRNWGANATRTVRPLTGLCICAECGWRMRYASGRNIPSMRCSQESCSQVHRTTREELIIRYALTHLTAKAAETMAAAAEQRISPEIIELQRQIEALQRLNDPDTALIIKAKQDRLQSIQAEPQTDQELIQKIADPSFANYLTRDGLIHVFHGLVKSITITKQQPTKIELKI